MEINRLAGEVCGAGRPAAAAPGEAAKKAGKTSCGEGGVLSSLKVLFPEKETALSVRAERIEQLKAAIAAGEYNPDPAAVARKILGVE